MPGLNSIAGLTSGLNTTEIIDSLIQFERRNAGLFEQQVVDQTNIVSTLKALQAKFIALSTEISNLTKRTTFDLSSVAVSDDTKLKATATGKLGRGSYDIQVLALARNHQVASQGISDESLASMGTGTINIQVGTGSTNNITIDSTNNSLVGIKNAINGAKMGVTASIVNDGSSSNPYRLILSAEKTGVSNKITITSSLTGGTNLNFATSTFDSPEIVSFNASSDSAVTLGGTASFTGTQNKIYTFTVKGSGLQTVGSGNIDIDWTDGTNSGTITVAAAATEVALAGAGSEGLKLSFSAGELTAGDTFQVSTFAPLLQSASDAKITIGSTGGAGSPITVTSATNSFKSVVNGLEVNVLSKTLTGESVTINTSLDTTGIRKTINEFIKRYNEVNEFIDSQNSFNPDTKESGYLFGDLTVQTVQNSLRKALGSRVSGLDGQFNQLFSIGIRTLATGRLTIADVTKFDNALENNLEDVIKLFTNSAGTSSSFVEFLSASSETKAGEAFEVNITQAATHGRLQGAAITDPATSSITLNSLNNRLRFKVDSVESDEIILTEKTYGSINELVNELKDKISTDPKIGNRDINVEWMSTGPTTGYILLTSNTYGSTSKIEINTSIGSSAFAILGLAGGSSIEGSDVEGTINGETAEGIGQFLTGKVGSAKTEGLKLKITLNNNQLIDGSEGIITVTRGLGSRLNDLVDSITAIGEGTFDRKIKSVEKQIESLNVRISAIDERLVIRRQTLLQQFFEMESALSELNGQSQFLTGQISQLNRNWSSISGR